MTLNTLDEVQAAFAALPEIGDREDLNPWTLVAKRRGWSADDDGLEWGGAHALLLWARDGGGYELDWQERGPYWECNRSDFFATLAEATAVFEAQFSSYAAVGERVAARLHDFAHGDGRGNLALDLLNRATDVASHESVDAAQRWLVAQLDACPRCDGAEMADPELEAGWRELIAESRRAVAGSTGAVA